MILAIGLVGCIELGQAPPNLGPLPDASTGPPAADRGAPDAAVDVSRADDVGGAPDGASDGGGGVDGGPADHGAADQRASDAMMVLEACNGIDDDGDGSSDEDIVGGEACTSDGLGRCAPGELQCFGGAWQCIASNTPTAESCDGVDEDCDGRTDEDDAFEPLSRACYDGPDGTVDVGACRAGRAVCVDGVFGPCEGAVEPVAEVCDGRDEDCNGRVDDLADGESCACQPDEARPCYSGAPDTEGVGPCRGGMQRCQPDGRGWQACADEVVPLVEACNGIDDDCDGTVDDGVLNACGACGAPPAEVCNGQDDDCDRVIDEGVRDCEPIMRCTPFLFEGRNNIFIPIPDPVGGGDAVRLIMVESYRPRGAQRYGFTILAIDNAAYVADLAGEMSSIEGRVCTLTTGTLGGGIDAYTSSGPVELERPMVAGAQTELVLPLWVQYVLDLGADFLWFTAAAQGGTPGSARFDTRGGGTVNGQGVYLRFGPSFEMTRCAVDVFARDGAGQCELDPPAPNYRPTLIRPLTAWTRVQTPEALNAMWWSSDCEENNNGGWTCTVDAGGTNDASARVRAEFHMIWKQATVIE